MTSNGGQDGDPNRIPPDWRRLGFAIAFFLACLALFVALVAIGFYH